MLEDYRNQRVRVYWNLHRDVFSVQQKGRVIGYAKHLRLRDVRFDVQPAGLARARKEHKKNVHAFVTGILAEVSLSPLSTGQGFVPVRYDLWEQGAFITVDAEQEVQTAERVVCAVRISKGRMRPTLQAKCAK